MYKRILITSLIDPFHLAFGQILDVYHFVDDWIGEAALSDSAPDRKRAGIFAIDPASDARPSSVLQRDADCEGPELRYLDINRLLARLQQEINNLKAQSEPADLQLSLLKRMARDWGLPPKRHAPRENVTGEVHLASGLHAIYHFISGGQSPPSPTASAAPAADSDEAFLSGDAGFGPLTGQELSASYALEGWQVVNKGPSGIGVISAQRPGQYIRVGELVGLTQTPDGGKGWTVGVIRWLVVKNSGEYLAGVQLLGRSPAAVAVHGRETSGGSDVVPGLLLAGQNGAAGASLILPAGSFEPGRSVLVEQADGRAISATLNNLLERTVAYEQAHFGTA
jgi:hypothetical protein